MRACSVLLYCAVPPLLSMVQLLETQGSTFSSSSYTMPMCNYIVID